MEPGFAFLTSSRGCAPFTVRIETLYLSATAGTEYYVDWGDGTSEETYVQTNSTGVIVQHTYPNSPTDCGYNVVIDAANTCNPRGSVVPVTTQVVVWTNDIVAAGPSTYRVCYGFSTTIQFQDNSDWNCFPRATRENNEPRWIQWLYGTGASGSRISGILVDAVAPGSFPYNNPDPLQNPRYPVTSPGTLSLPISVPITTAADIGKEFVVVLKNWNQCNPYDDDLTDGNPRNPVSGDLVNGDHSPQTTTARIVIVDRPEPDFETRLGGPGGPIQSTFCVDDDIYFDNNTPPISGAAFSYTWEFFDNATGTGSPMATKTSTNPIFSYSTSGTKLIRLHVVDANTAGGCEAVFEKTVLISPSLIAHIATTDLSDNPIVADFCQEPNAPLSTFDVRFHDASSGTVTANTQWRWEFYDALGVIIGEEPAGGGYSSSILGPFDKTFVGPGNYRVVLMVRDNGTSCVSTDEAFVRVFEKPLPDFSFSSACFGEDVTIDDASTLNATFGESIASREWDMDYDGVSFSTDTVTADANPFPYHFAAPGPHVIALRVTATMPGCSATKVDTVIVDANPVSDFSADVTEGCSPLSVTFTNNSISGQTDLVEQFTWEVDSGNGSGFQVDSIQHPDDPGFSAQYTKVFYNQSTVAKVYTERLVVQLVTGCQTVSSPVQITTRPAPASGFATLNYDPFDDNCSPVDVDFEAGVAAQSFNPSDYSWIVSDGTGTLDSISTGVAPTFSYGFVNNTQNIKDFNVKLKVTIAGGCVGDSSRKIQVRPVPSSQFNIDTIRFDCDTMVLKMTAVQPGLNAYHWTVLSNGNITYDASVLDDFLVYETARSMAGDKMLHFVLQTQNFANCLSPETAKDIVVPEASGLQASFSASPTVLTLPETTVTIVNNTPPGSWTYDWDFGDGHHDTTANVSPHTYNTYGSYVIQLTVSDSMCSDEQLVTITINPIPPVLDFEYNPESGCAPLEVEFTNRSLYADTTTYAWQFGTGQGSSRATNPSYTYYEPGVYSVTLKATNITGDTVSVTKQSIIEVYPVPVARFDVKPKLLNIPGDKLYTKNQSIDADLYLWDFGDGITSDVFEPEHIYTVEGEYTVSLIAMNLEGCADTTVLSPAVKVRQSGQLLIPNAFSPSLSGPGSGSGTNDTFLPLLRGVNDFQMQIFDRWGELLFETTNPDSGWDGYYNGRLCQQDVYVYKIVATYGDGRMLTRIGDVHLIR